MDGIDILNGLRRIDVSMTCFFPFVSSYFLSLSSAHSFIPIEFDTIKNECNLTFNVMELSFCLQAQTSEDDNIRRNAFESHR